MKSASKRFTVIISQAPFGCRSGQNAIEAILAITIFDQPISVIFTEDGVFQLQTSQGAEKLNIKEYRQQLKDLTLYGADRLYLDTDSARQRGVDESDLSLKVEWVNHHQISEILSCSDHILTF